MKPLRLLREALAIFFGALLWIGAIGNFLFPPEWSSYLGIP